VVKVVYIYNLKEGVDRKEFEEYYFNVRIPQVMQIPNLLKFSFSIATDEKPAYRYIAENYYKDLETAKKTLSSDYFKGVHTKISDKLADMKVMFYEINEWIPSEYNKNK
jgi:uncharacterized protein (TIGR02118 family)